MMDTRPTLYLSRLLPDPVMAVVRERFRLVQDPHDALPAPSALREGLCQADAAIVTLGDRIDAETIHAATRLKILANYAVGYNNIDLVAARQRGLVVTNTPDVLTDATADLTWGLVLATARRVVEGDVLFGLDKHNSLGLHPIDACIHRIGSERRVVIFHFIAAYRGTKV